MVPAQVHGVVGRVTWVPKRRAYTVTSTSEMLHDIWASIQSMALDRGTEQSPSLEDTS